MRQFIYTTFLIVLGFSLLSNSGGLGSAQGKGGTGAPGDEIASCGNCHTNGPGNSSATLTLVDETGETVSKYVAKSKYKVRLMISSSDSPAGYGFQMVSLFNDNDSDTDGFGTSQGDVNVVSINDRKYAESKKTLTSKVIEVDWVAPESTSDVTFYSAFNAVNGSGNTKGDDPGQVSLTVEAMTSAIENTSFEAVLSPNPCSDQIEVKANGVTSYEIYDMQGSLMKSNELQTSGVIHVNSLQPGLHIIVLKKENKQVRAMKFLKLN